MDQIYPYIDLKGLATSIVYQEYFQQTVIFVTVLASFLYGRLTRDRRLTHVIDMVNDADKTRQKLSTQLSGVTKSLQSIKFKKKLLIGGTVLILAILALKSYLLKRGDPYLVMSLMGIVFIFWVIYSIRIRYLQWMKNRLQTSLKHTNMTANSEITQILHILGKDVESRLKSLYDSEIVAARIKESQESCKLFKCYTNKKVYNELYKLYEQVIDEIKKVNLCDICLHQRNITTQQLNLTQFQNQINKFKKSLSSGNLELPEKKQLVNRMMIQYQNMEVNLNYICRKGCCIRQRILIEMVKDRYHERLKKLMSQI